MIAAYLRVSSRGQSVEMQRTAIEQAVRTRGGTIDVWFSEKRRGAGVEREQLDRLRSDVKAGRFSLLYVYRLDRLSRGSIRETLSIVEEFREHGCRIETIADGFTLGGPASDIVLAVLAWSAQMERAAISQRISDARERIEREGGTWGRPARVTSVVRERIQSLRAKGRTVREIAMSVKVPRPTVQRVLSQKGAYKRQVPKPLKKAVSGGRPPASH
jgi:DNA invertase Pin-like site-specific DNA recombinase